MLIHTRVWRVGEHCCEDLAELDAADEEDDRVEAPGDHLEELVEEVMYLHRD